MAKVATFVLLILGAARAGAVAVPQHTAEDYIFTRPKLPSNITGNVIGEAPITYSVMRSEDIAWLHEAYAERVALAKGWNVKTSEVDIVPTFGKWPMSETNRFLHWTTATEWDGTALATNIIVGYVAVTNIGPAGVDSADIEVVDPGDFLDVGPLANDAGAVGGFLSLEGSNYIAASFAYEHGDPEWDTKVVTNIYQETVYFDSSTNFTDFVSMAMTNGTTSVHTNVWEVYCQTSMVVTVTNITTQESSGEKLLFKDRLIHGYGRKRPGKLRGLYDSAALTNHLAFLRGCSRLMRTPSGVANMFEESWSWYEMFNGAAYGPDTITKQVKSGPYFQSSTYRTSTGRYEVKHDNTGSGSWESAGTIDGNGNSTKISTGRRTYRVMGREAIPDGQTITVSCRSLWAFVICNYECDAVSWREEISGTVTPVENVNYYYTNRSWTAVMQLAKPILYSQDGTNVCFDMEFDVGFMQAAWGLTDAPTALPASQTYAPDLMFGVPDAQPGPSWGPGESPTLCKVGESTTDEDFTVSLNFLVMILDVKPLTSLPGW